MMPKWSLGFSNFEWNIDEDEFYEMVELYRAKNIPSMGMLLTTTGSAMVTTITASLHGIQITFLPRPQHSSNKIWSPRASR